MKALRVISIIIHFFVGIGAMAGGSAAIMNPESPLGISPDTLRYGSFSSFLIPGITLFVLIGVINVAAGIIVLLRVKLNEYATGIAGAILAAWIIIQCMIIGSIYYLHVIFFVIGIIQGIMSLYILYRKNLFPMNF